MVVRIACKKLKKQKRNFLLFLTSALTKPKPQDQLNWQKTNIHLH